MGFRIKIGLQYFQCPLRMSFDQNVTVPYSAYYISVTWHLKTFFDYPWADERFAAIFLNINNDNIKESIGTWVFYTKFYVQAVPCFCSCCLHWQFGSLKYYFNSLINILSQAAGWKLNKLGWFEYTKFGLELFNKNRKIMLTIYDLLLALFW